LPGSTDAQTRVPPALRARHASDSRPRHQPISGAQEGFFETRFWPIRLWRPLMRRIAQFCVHGVPAPPPSTVPREAGGTRTPAASTVVPSCSS